MIHHLEQAIATLQQHKGPFPKTERNAKIIDQLKLLWL